MSNYVLLNNVEHKNLKVITDHSSQYGDDMMCAITFPQELRTIQGIYPIFFTKDTSTGKFYPAAIFGFREGENLFLNENGWDANYIPISVKRLPFLIGYQNTQVNGGIQQGMVVHVDLDSPRISESEGEAVFLPHGGSTKYLEEVTTMLEYINIGNKFNEDFVDLLLEFDLIESFSLEIELKNGSKNSLVGFYTINEDKLAKLDANALEKLHSKGFLDKIYFILASMSNIAQLIAKIEAKVAATGI